MELKYEDRVLAFVDILGWSAILKRSETDESALAPIAQAIELLETPSSFLRSAGNVPAATGQLKRELVVGQFSDTLVVSAPATEPHMAVVAAIIDVVCYRLLLAGHPTRGAIVRGKLHHQGSRILGPALVDAHIIESKVAKYPRIVVAPSVEPLLSRFLGGEGGVIRSDADGLKSFDYLAQVDRPEAENAEVRARLRAWAREQQEENASDLDRRAKYGWLMSFVDMVRPRSPMQHRSVDTS